MPRIPPIGRDRLGRTFWLHQHVLWVEGDDGGYRGIDGDNELRWLNHSSSPNVEFDGPVLFALVDIEPDTELCFHYGEEWEHVD